MLLPPVVLDSRALTPLAVLLLPVVLLKSALHAAGVFLDAGCVAGRAQTRRWRCCSRRFVLLRGALFRNTTGNYNTASGLSALFSNTTGGYNTASGAFALFSNTTGIQTPPAA